MEEINKILKDALDPTQQRILGQVATMFESALDWFSDLVNRTNARVEKIEKELAERTKAVEIYNAIVEAKNKKMDQCLEKVLKFIQKCELVGLI